MHAKMRYRLYNNPYQTLAHLSVVFQEYARLVLYYNRANLQCEFGIELYDSLPPIRQQHLSKMDIVI